MPLRLILLTLLILPCAALSQEAAQNRQDFPRPIVIYMNGSLTGEDMATFGSYLLTSLVNSGACVSHENSGIFLDAVNNEQKIRQVVLDDDRLCVIGRYFGIKYVCAVSVVPASGAAPGVFAISARMLNTETVKARLTGEATGPIRGVNDLRQAAAVVANKLLGKQRAPNANAPAEPEPAAATAAAAPATVATAAEPADAQAAAEPAGKRTVAVYMSGREPKGAAGAHKIIGGEIANVMSESDKYAAEDRTEAVVQELKGESGYHQGAALDDEHVKSIGQKLGVQYLCVSDIKFVNAVGGRYRLNTRLLDVTTAEIARSADAVSNLKDADEMTLVGRDLVLDLLDANRAIERNARKKLITRSTALSLNALGALTIGYGCYENYVNVAWNAKKYGDGKYIKDGPAAERAAKRRNAAYIAGGVIFASGVAVHIIF